MTVNFPGKSTCNVDHSTVICEDPDCSICAYLNKVLKISDAVEPIIAQAEALDRVLNPPPPVVASDRT